MATIDSGKYLSISTVLTTSETLLNHALVQQQKTVEQEKEDTLFESKEATMTTVSLKQASFFAASQSSTGSTITLGEAPDLETLRAKRLAYFQSVKCRNCRVATPDY